GVEDRLIDAVAEFLFTPRQGGETALAAGPVARHGVEQSQSQPVLFEPLGDDFRRMLVGEQELDTLEAGARGRIEPVEKADLLEHHAEIGGEIRHGALPGLPAARQRATLAIRPGQRKAHGEDLPRCRTSDGRSALLSPRWPSCGAERLAGPPSRSRSGS